MSAAATLDRPVPTPDLTALTARQQATWASGDFAVIGTTLQIVGESLAEAADVRAGARVLDVAAGNGNATLAAARRFAVVTSTDYVPALLARAAARAAAEGLAVEFRSADAQDLPFSDGAFDVVLSSFGAMFAPDQQRTAAELLRVTRPGGRIGLANWTPDGFVGDLFRTIAAHVPPAAGAPSPMRWGDPAHLASLFDAGAARIAITRRDFMFRYRSPDHWIQVFRDYYGPTHQAFAALDERGRAALAADLTALLERWNAGGGQSLVVPGEYLEVVVTRY